MDSSTEALDLARRFANEGWQGVSITTMDDGQHIVSVASGRMPVGYVDRRCYHEQVCCAKDVWVYVKTDKDGNQFCIGSVEWSADGLTFQSVPCDHPRHLYSRLYFCTNCDAIMPISERLI